MEHSPPITEKPLVSIGMPVWNGELFLEETVRSLLEQEYQHIELIILDNLSTDRTGEICSRFMAADNRVRYIKDSQQRDVMEAHRELIKLARGPLFMVGCDDDIYDPKYISSLVPILLSDPAIGLAYTGCNSLYPDGSRQPSIWKWRIDSRGSRLVNFMKYFFKRMPIPICFGLMRTAVHVDGLKYFYRPDNRGWNHDNLYMLRILSITKVHSIPDLLFHYRERDRTALYKKRGQFYFLNNGFQQFWNTMFHQLSVSKKALRIVADSPFSFAGKLIAGAYISVCTFYFAFGYKIIVPVVRPVRRFILGIEQYSEQK